MKNFAVLIMMIASAVAGRLTGADELTKRAKSALAEAEAELAKIENSEGSQNATSEISAARELIGKGRMFLAEGQLKKAAAIAERLPLQLDLIRTLILIQNLNSRTEKNASETKALSNKLAIERARLQRLLEMYGEESKAVSKSSEERSK